MESNEVIMAWLATDLDNTECIYQREPAKTPYGKWTDSNAYEDDSSIVLPKGSIRKLINKELTWEDEPVELKEE